MDKAEAKRIFKRGSKAVVQKLIANAIEISTLNSKIDRLETKVAQLSKNSSNSSKRPSSDDITKPNNNLSGKQKEGQHSGCPPK